MKKLGVLLVCAIVAIISCEEGFNEPKESIATSSESHNWGMNCMQCHAKGGPGSGWFTAAGSVQNSNDGKPLAGNAKIELWKVPGTGKPVKVIEVDQLGNFYTTSKIDWGRDGLYPAVVGPSGNRIFMPYKTKIGACNSCHNNKDFAPMIWAY